MASKRTAKKGPEQSGPTIAKPPSTSRMHLLLSWKPALDEISEIWQRCVKASGVQLMYQLAHEGDQSCMQFVVSDLFWKCADGEPLSKLDRSMLMFILSRVSHSSQGMNVISGNKGKRGARGQALKGLQVTALVLQKMYAAAEAGTPRPLNANAEDNSIFSEVASDVGLSVEMVAKHWAKWHTIYEDKVLRMRELETVAQEIAEERRQ